MADFTPAWSVPKLLRQAVLGSQVRPRERAQDTMARRDKGAIVPAPPLSEPLDQVVSIVCGWPDVCSTGHWNPFHPDSIDGVDFYVGEEELGHIHFDGSLHLATPAGLGRELVQEGLARPFRLARGWVAENVHQLGAEAAVALFRRNYELLSNLD